MGTSLNATLEIAKQTLQNTQVAIQTSSHNIANADNTSYARQEVQFATTPALQLPDAWVGTGAKVSGIKQDRDQFIERQLRDATTQKSGYETLSSELDSASAILADNGDSGISQSLGAFWDAWDSLNQDPSGTSTSSSIVQSAAKTLATTIRQTYRNLTDFAQGVKDQIDNDVTQVNTLLGNIAQSNKEIVKSEAGGQTANDLRDSRYQYLTQLAQLVPIQTTQESNGSVTVNLKGTSVSLVNADQASTLQYTSSQEFQFQDSAGNTTTFANGLAGGGTLDSLNKTYQEFGTQQNPLDTSNPPSNPTYLDRLNLFAANLIQTVNDTHDANGAGNVFTPATASFNAGQIQVAGGFTPDSSQALDISDLQNQQQPGLGNATFAQYLGDIQQQIGTQASDASTQADFQNKLYQQLQTQQQSVSGVSVDEELVNIIKYQQVYSAAAKTIQATSDMLNTVINAVQ